MSQNTEQRFYKVRLANGRVLGPLDLQLIRNFIIKNHIIGVEEAKLYPEGKWQDINTYPEIADLLLQKLEGKLDIADVASQPNLNKDADIVEADPSQSIKLEEPSKTSSEPSKPSISKDGDLREEATVIVRRPEKEEDDRTIIIPKEDSLELQIDQTNAFDKFQSAELETRVGQKRKSGIADEPTQMLTRYRPGEAAISAGNLSFQQKLLGQGKKKKTWYLIALFGVGLVLLLSPTEEKRPGEAPPFKVLMPELKDVDPQKSEHFFFEAIREYNLDTISGYKSAAKSFREASSYDANNVKALCLLASTYMNLIEVVDRDDAFLTVVTRLIELERAKGVDLPETVIADVELYLMLGNPDAALSRIVEYTKAHQFGVEMFYYLALSLYTKGEYDEALKYLGNIDHKDFFSARIPYLYGMLYKKTGRDDEAIASFHDAVKRSAAHVKSRVELVELLYKRDVTSEAMTHAQFVITNKSQASKSELARAYYYRSKLNLVQKFEDKALADIESAFAIGPKNPDIVLEYYAQKARSMPAGKGAEFAKMYAALAEGEREFQARNYDEAEKHFLTARDSAYESAQPLVRLSQIYQIRGDLIAAKNSLEKAVKLRPKDRELYPDYIQVLIDSYEFAEAAKQLEAYKNLEPSVSLYHRLQGDLALKQDRFQEALVFYKQALASTNADSAVYLGYAKFLYRTANYRDAAFYYGLATRFDPFNIEATTGVAKSLTELEGLESGLRYLQNALARNPNKAALFDGMAELHLRKNAYPQAHQFVKNALDSNPKYAGAYETRGLIFAAEEKWKDALESFGTYKKLMPSDPAGGVERYRIFMRKLDYKSAKEEIQGVIRDFPRYPGAYTMLGEMYKDSQNLNAAAEAAVQEIQNNPGYIPAYVLAGTVYNMGKDATRAIEVLNRGLRMQPENHALLIQAGFANHQLKAYAAAQSLYERALAKDPGNPQIHKRMASLFFEMGDTAKMKEHLKQYLDLLPDAPDRSEVERLLEN